MKRGLIILAFALLAGVAGFVVSPRLPIGDSAHPRDGETRLPELEWLRRELNLTDAQFERVSELHVAYRPTCGELCARVMASHEKIAKLAKSDAKVTPELQTALAEHAALHVECQTAMLNHIYQTAECLGQEQAQRYLSAMLPQVIELPLEPGGAESNAHQKN